MRDVMRGVVAVRLVALGAACADEDLVRRRTEELPPSTRVVLTHSRGPLRQQPAIFYRYEAKAGDTLEIVAQRFGLAPESVASNNEAALASGELGPRVLL